MGTLIDLNQRRPRKTGPVADTLSVTAFGFCIGPTFVPWQAVTTIHASRVQAGPNEDVVLEFAAHGQCLPVRAAQPGFAALDAAMVAAFPDTAGWREELLASSRPHGRTLLYRRP